MEFGTTINNGHRDSHMPIVHRRMCRFDWMRSIGAVTIRPMSSIDLAKAEDAAGIEACLRAAFEPYRERYTPGAFRDTVVTEEGVRRRIETMMVLVARAPSGIVVGTIGASVQGHEGHLRGMAVSPEWQGEGIAQRLLETIEEKLSGAGCKVISLDTTLPLSRAIAFYERHGYRASGVVTDFFGMPLHEYRKRI